MNVEESEISVFFLERGIMHIQRLCANDRNMTVCVSGSEKMGALSTESGNIVSF